MMLTVWRVVRWALTLLAPATCLLWALSGYMSIGAYYLVGDAQLARGNVFIEWWVPEVAAWGGLKISPANWNTPEWDWSLPYLDLSDGRVRVPCWLLVPLLTLATTILWRRDRCRRRPGRCRKCNYNLTGNTSGVCPECGLATPRQQSETAL